MEDYISHCEPGRRTLAYCIGNREEKGENIHSSIKKHEHTTDQEEASCTQGISTEL